MTFSATGRHTLKLADEFVKEAERIRDRRILKYFPIGSWVRTVGLPPVIAGKVYAVEDGHVLYTMACGRRVFSSHEEVEPCAAPAKRIIQPKMEGKKVCRKKK